MELMQGGDLLNYILEHGAFKEYPGFAVFRPHLRKNDTINGKPVLR